MRRPSLFQAIATSVLLPSFASRFCLVCSSDLLNSGRLDDPQGRIRIQADEVGGMTPTDTPTVLIAVLTNTALYFFSPCDDVRIAVQSIS